MFSMNNAKSYLIDLVPYLSRLFLAGGRNAIKVGPSGMAASYRNARVVRINDKLLITSNDVIPSDSLSRASGGIEQRFLLQITGYSAVLFAFARFAARDTLMLLLVHLLPSTLKMTTRLNYRVKLP